MKSFLLGSVVDAIINQVMITVNEKKLRLTPKLSNEVKTLSLYGDQIRLQQILADFLLNIVRHTPSPDGWVEIKIAPILKTMDGHVELVRLQFRYIDFHCFFLSCTFMYFCDYVQLRLRSFSSFSSYDV